MTGADCAAGEDWSILIIFVNLGLNLKRVIIAYKKSHLDK